MFLNSNKYLKSFLFSLCLVLISLYLLFCSGIVYSEPHAVKKGGFIYVIGHYLVLTVMTYGVFFFLAKGQIKYSFELSSLFLIIPTVISIFFSVMQLGNPQYFPEILAGPILNFSYLSLLFKIIEKNWMRKKGEE